MKTKQHNRQAFTLIEMILAIGVTALALLCAGAVLFTTLRLREAANRMVEAALPVEQAITFLRRDLQGCVTPTNGTSKVLSGSFRAGNGITSTGVGEPVSVEMFTATGALSQGAPWADIQRVTYGLKNATDTSGRRDLYRSVVRNLLSTALPDVEEQLMLPGVDSVQFYCYDGAQWLDTWDTSDSTAVQTNLPLAVRVLIQMAGDSEHDALQIVVPIDSVSRTNRVLTSSTGS
jgi:type II secretion system protein J